MSVPAAQVLIDARELLCNEGWIQGSECKNSPGIGMSYCSLGAILKAAGELKTFPRKEQNGATSVGWVRPNWNNLSEVATEAIEVLAHQLGDKYEPLEDFTWAAVEDFNDEADRTLPEVLAAFDRAIEAAKAE